MTDIQPAGQQPMSDDQELAKVLAGISNETGVIDSDDPTDQPAETMPPLPVPTPAAPDPVVEPVVETPVVMPVMPDPVAPVEDTTLGTVAPEPLPSPSPSPVGDLEGIKKDAIVELRPLVDKLTLAPDEKFDTYLLLLRSTDDKELIGPAHEAAKNITDETRRAQALLEIIKEIDYLSGQKPA